MHVPNGFQALRVTLTTLAATRRGNDRDAHVSDALEWTRRAARGTRERRDQRRRRLTRARALGFIALRAYLNLFVQRAALTTWPFVASFVVTLAIAWLAIAAHVLAAARVRPADVLRYQ